MSETILLDPAAITGGSRVELQISGDGDGPIEVRQDGVDFGEAAIEAVMAEQVVGANVVDFEIPNRIIEMKVKIQASGATTFAQARSLLQAKVALIQAEGGWLSREMPGVGTVYADLVNAKLTLPGDWMQAHRDLQVEATLSFEAIPDFYEVTWEEADPIVGTDGEAIGLIEGIRGDFPLGNRCRLTVENTSSDDQLAAEWGFRNRHYDAAASAALSYEAEDLDVLDSATVVTQSGASGGATDNAVRHSALTGQWRPVVGAVLGTTEMTHTGSYRAVARVLTTSETPPALRLVYGVGDMLTPAVNPEVVAGLAGSFYVVDLGEVRLDRTGAGDHEWGWQLQAMGAGANITVDRIRFRPIAERSGVLRAAPVDAYSLAALLGEDTFDQSSGNLTGKVSTTGQTYAAITGSDAGDFIVNDTDHRAQRSVVSDAAYTGRYLRFGSIQPSAVSVSLDVLGISISDPANVAQLVNVRRGVFARLVDINNWLAAWLFYTSEGRPYVIILKRVGGVVSALGVTEVAGTLYWGENMRVGIDVDTAGNVSAFLSSGSQSFSISTNDPDLAAGGVLDDGYTGIYDENLSAVAFVREYDNLRIDAPSTDAVVRAGGTCEIATDGPHLAVRDTATGGFGPVAVTVGDRPRLPQGDTEVMVATSRSDYATRADGGLDLLSVTVAHRRCWLTVPGQEVV
jgi:hypothetical protein